MDDKIVTFTPRKQEDKPIFKKALRYDRECSHGNFTIDEATDTVECGACKAKLSPMWVLKQLANKNSQLYWWWVDMEKKAEKTKNKMRCKCEHCKQMTRISR